MKLTLVLAFVGAGYVGLANALLLARNDGVVAIDIVPEKVALLNQRKLSIAEKVIRALLAFRVLNKKITEYHAPRREISDLGLHLDSPWPAENKGV